jgi:hypothetical protein
LILKSSPEERKEMQEAYLPAENNRNKTEMILKRK